MTEDEENEKRIKELEEKVRRLEEERVGTSEEVIVGDIFPGLSRLIKRLRNVEEFGQRFEEVDREIEENLKKGGRRTSMGRRPHIETDFSIRTLGEAMEKRSTTSKGSVEEKRRGGQRSRVKNIRMDEENIKGREPLVDVIDESEEITIIAEMPGVEEEEIKTAIGGDNGTKLIISTEGEVEEKRKYYKEVDLPSPVKREIKISYKHGVLTLKLEKEADEKKEGGKGED